MPFTKGHVLSIGKGRKGFEFEYQQLELMRRIVSKDLKIVEKIYDGKATDEDFKKLNALQSRVSKYLDKLHPTKQNTEITSEGKPLPILNIKYIVPDNTR